MLIMPVKGKHVVGDEYHMVIECEFFNVAREVMSRGYVY